MFLHDQKELPLVRDLGFNIAPGRHALIGVQRAQVSNPENISDFRKIYVLL